MCGVFLIDKNDVLDRRTTQPTMAQDWSHLRRGMAADETVVEQYPPSVFGELTERGHSNNIDRAHGACLRRAVIVGGEVVVRASASAVGVGHVEGFTVAAHLHGAGPRCGRN